MGVDEEQQGKMDVLENEEELQELFKSIDTDGSESLSLSEVILFLKSICADISEDNVEKIFSNFDSTGDKIVDYEEFKEVMSQVTSNGWQKCAGTSDGAQEEEIKALFDMIDKDKSGSLSEREAKKACKLIEDRFGVDEVEEWLEKTDYNRDGSVSWEEFKFSIAGNMINC